MVVTVNSGSVFTSKVWVPEMFIKMLSKGVLMLQNSGEEEVDRCLESSQYVPDLKTNLFIKQQTDSSCQTNNSCHAGSNEKPKTRIMEIGEKIDDGDQDHEKNHCAGNEEMSRNVEKKQTFPHPGLKSKRRKIGASHAALWTCILMLFLCLLPAQGADLRDRQPRKHDTSMNFCETYRSNLSQSSGPWNASMCSSELKKIHCQTGEIKDCVPFVSEDSKDSFFACCIKIIRDLKDNQCLFITQIKESNQKVAQCYEGKNYCSPTVSTSPPTFAKSTQDPLTVNTTNPLPESLSQNTEPSKGLTTAACAFPVCCLIILAICFIIVLWYILVMPDVLRNISVSAESFGPN